MSDQGSEVNDHSNTSDQGSEVNEHSNTSEFLRASDFPSEKWNDWRWQMQNSIKTVNAIRRWIQVTDEETQAIQQLSSVYRWAVTPYYASRMNPFDPHCPVRRQAIPSLREANPVDGAEIDPVGDMKYRKTNRIIHKYPDRVVLLVTRNCPVYCRFCTRKYHTTNVMGSYFESGESENFEQDIEYIARNKQIRDVLLTGGDPLMYSDDKLEYLIGSLRRLSHVEIIRIGTRFPVLLPQRITESFCAMLAKYHPIWVNTHFNHPQEISDESTDACNRLITHGIPVGNQTVLLSGVNDQEETMRRLLTQLVRIRVRPYYLYHCDNVVGISHFITTVERGRQLMDSLNGYLTGFAVPQYVLTTALGKIPLTREYIRWDGDGYLLTNYEGKTIRVSEYVDKI